MSYYIRVYIEAPGTPTADGGSSTAGHMWYSLTDNEGNPFDYGFGPRDGATGSERINGPGEPRNSDRDYYTTDVPTYSSDPIEITEDQYNAMTAFGNDPASYDFSMWYDVLHNSCVDFVYAALEAGGFNPLGYEGRWLPMDNAVYIDSIFALFANKPLGEIIGGSMFGGLNPDDLRDLFGDASRTKSPLVFDLDDDGIETTIVGYGTYFDHDGNGFAERTGWVGPDDGLLVMDRNGNGIIDNGTELFGNHTILNNGKKAANGFQALAELDDNQDGKIDASDAAYYQLKVWQDLDSNGYSAADELKSLDELGIQSINTGYTNADITDANGNIIKQTGTFTWEDGTTGAAADVWLQTDNMYTIANEWLDVPEEIAALPNMWGYGNVYDLHQAMVRDESGQLKVLVEQFAAETDAENNENLVNNFKMAA
jgi:hypothetical protein